MFYLEKQKEVNTEKRKALVECFASLSTDISLLESQDDFESEKYVNTLAKLRNEYPVKFVIHSEDSFSTDVKKLYLLKQISVNLIKAYRKILSCYVGFDHMIIQLRKSTTIISGKYFIEISKWYVDSTKILSGLKAERLDLLSQLNRLSNEIDTNLHELEKIAPLTAGKIKPKINDAGNAICNISNILNIKEGIEQSILKIGGDSAKTRYVHLPELDLGFGETVVMAENIRLPKTMINTLFTTSKLRFEQSILDYIKSL
jgi:hypothetical protein